jgi:hypothetical protein
MSAAEGSSETAAGRRQYGINERCFNVFFKKNLYSSRTTTPPPIFTPLLATLQHVMCAGFGETTIHSLTHSLTHFMYNDAAMFK